MQSVDANAGTIALKGPLKTDKSTRVTRDGKESSISDIRPGDEVRAAYLHGKDEGPITQLDVRSHRHEAKEAPKEAPTSK